MVRKTEHFPVYTDTGKRGRQIGVPVRDYKKSINLMGTPARSKRLEVLYDEINEFLRVNNITKVRLIVEGYEALKRELSNTTQNK